MHFELNGSNIYGEAAHRWIMEGLWRLLGARNGDLRGNNGLRHTGRRLPQGEGGEGRRANV